MAVYVTPAATAAFAETGRLRAAFSVSDLRPVLSSEACAAAWLTAVAIVVAVECSALSGIPVLGSVIAGVVMFYTGVA